jgi:hypothetical protein
MDLRLQPRPAISAIRRTDFRPRSSEDRAFGFYPIGREFESRRGLHHFSSCFKRAFRVP